MEIKRINKDQIRCILSQKDLEDRKIKISELTYGSEKANALFQDLILQASEKCDFKADNKPLMIEAIPLSPEVLILVITKNPDMDELNSRFSCFTDPEKDYLEDETEEDEEFDEGMCDEEQLLRRIFADDIKDEKEKTAFEVSPDIPELMDENLHLYRQMVFTFGSLDEVIAASKVVGKKYLGESELFKDNVNDRYYLILSVEDDQVSNYYSAMSNVLSDYGKLIPNGQKQINYFREHCQQIGGVKVLQNLCKL